MPHFLPDIRRHHGAVLFALGALVGLAAYFLVFGPLPLDVTNDALARGGYIERDIQQHYAGWLFYRQSPLAFPLCMAEGLGSGGISIAYTDSVPLAAVLFRVLSPILPSTFQYFGLFTLLCFLLQGGFAALLCGLFADGLAAPLLGSGLFALSPVLLERALRHTALGAQWLLLAALWAYFSIRRGGAGRAAWGLLFLTNILTIGIHPYFVPMTFAVTLALLLEEALAHRIWARAAAFLGADLAATAALGWALGLFASGSGGGAGTSYGYFAMNLNALWNPVGVNGGDWSLFLPAQNQVRGNYDAFAYLGLGVFAGLAAALWAAVRRRRLLQTLKTHWALACACLVLAAFAVSNVITANGATLAELPLPLPLLRLCSVFRSGGRMFWVPYYLLLLFAFLGAVRIGRPRAGALCAALLLAVQITDISPGIAQHRAAVEAAYQTPAFPTAMHSDFWALAAERYDTIASMDGLQADALHLALYAADNGMTTNDPFAARYDEAALNAQCAALLAELGAGAPRADTLYLFNTEEAFLRAADTLTDRALCGCVDDAWYVIAPGMQGIDPPAGCRVYDEHWPLRIPDYNDALWRHGVLSTDTSIICFYDTPFARRTLEGAAALRAGGRDYAILLVDDSDPGWLMVTLDTADAAGLVGQTLEAVAR